MKKLLSIFAVLSIAAASVFTVSCNKDKTIDSSDLTVEITMPEGFASSATFDGEVIITDQITCEVFKTNAEKSVAKFEKLPFSVYTVSVNKVLSKDEYKAMAPELPTSSDEICLTGNTKVILAEVATGPAAVSLSWSVPSTLLISKVYNFGTLNLAEKPYNLDKYIEIFNNSNETQYLDGMYIGEAYGGAVSPSGYDDVKTAGVCYMQKVVKVPGNGTQFPIEPGKSLVFAMNAKNHIDAATITNTVDLTNADLEAYVEGAASSFPADNANVPNIIDVFSANTYSAKFFVSQGAVLTLFNMTESEFNALQTVVVPGSDAYGAMYAYYCKPVPNSKVLDAVDLIRIGFESRGGKHVPESVDAGNAQCNQKFITLRKIASIDEESGRIVLQDTNNSTNDFVCVESKNGDALKIRDYSNPAIQPAE